LGGRPALLCRPVGVHDGIAGLIERHALAACDHLGIPSRSVAILVVGHGSASEPGRALALHRHTARVAATELFARVEAACLEEAPFVTAALRGLRAHPVVVVGCFANQGGHVRDDLPALIAAEQVARRVSEKTATPGTERGAQGDLQGGASGADHFPVRFHGSIAADPAMLQIIIDQAEDRD
jgi:sirohydrochlorin cobaltochelatase